MRWLDAAAHGECRDDLDQIAGALLLTPSESGSYVVVLDSELDALRRDKARLEFLLAMAARSSVSGVSLERCTVGPHERKWRVMWRHHVTEPTHYDARAAIDAEMKANPTP